MIQKFKEKLLYWSSCLEAVAERSPDTESTLKALASDMDEWAEMVHFLIEAINGAEDGDEIVIYKTPAKAETVQ